MTRVSQGKTVTRSIQKTNKIVFSRWQKVERDAEDTMSSGKLFQTFGAATRNALLPTVCKRTEAVIDSRAKCATAKAVQQNWGTLEIGSVVQVV